MIFLDYLLTVVHLGVIAMVMFGWIAPATRRAHRWLIVLVLASWLLIGLFKGKIGYCFLTDWHWDIKRSLGETAMPASFVEYFVERSIGMDIAKSVVDIATVMGLVVPVVISIWLWWRETR